MALVSLVAVGLLLGCKAWSPIGRWNPGDPLYEGAVNPSDRSDSVPVAPSQLVATATAPARVVLSWQDNSGYESGFAVERRQGMAGAFAEIAQLDADTASYEDGAVTSLVEYSYRVKARNGSGPSGYTATVEITAAPALSSLVVSVGTLSPAFAPAVTSYAVEVPPETESFSVTPTSPDAVDVTVGGSAVTSGSTSQPIEIGAGTTQIQVVLTPQVADAAAVTYTISVTRSSGPSSNADLASLQFSTGTLTPAFDTSATSYTLAVLDGTTVVAVTPTVAGVGAAVTINGSSVSSGTLFDVDIPSGGTTIRVVVEAQDGTTREYAIMVTVNVATPYFSPGQGTYNASQAVEIRTDTSGASIRFTTDGSAPTTTAGTVYSAPVSVTAIKTLMAIAYKAGVRDSWVATATYTLRPFAPVLSPSGGTYPAVHSVTMSTSTPGASIRYTTDGTTPSSTVGTYYASAAPVGNTTLRAVAYRPGWADSAVSEAAYIVTGWAPEAYLKASNAEANDQFGHSVAVSGDTVVVGSSGEASNQTTITNGSTASSNNSATGSGAAYVFVRSGNTWSQQAYLKAPNAEAGDVFGLSVAVSGGTVVVGASGEASNQTTITNGNTASTDNSASGAGAAYVFVRSGGAWSQQAYLKAPNAEAGDSFGYSVAISGDTAVVGAVGEDSNQTTITNSVTASSNNSAAYSGAAYVFVRFGSTWSQEAYLKAPNAEAADYFGQLVAVSGDTVAVGAISEDSNQTTITNGSAASSDNSAADSGAVYVFVRSDSIWSQQAYLKAPNAEAGDYYGYSVAVAGDTLVVGASEEDSNQTTITNGVTASSDNSASGAGAAYVFVRSGGAWNQQAYLKAPNAEAYDGFGRCVAVSADTVVIGPISEDSNQTTITNGNTASSDNSAPNAGAAYVFVRSGATWSQQAYLKAPNADAEDVFGRSVSVCGDTVVVGAVGEDSNQTTITNGVTASSDNSAGAAGAAYVFFHR